MKNIIKNMPSIAYFSGWGGLEIKKIEYGIEDYVFYVSGTWFGIRKPHRKKIYYSNQPYFIHNGTRIHFCECIRID